MTPPAGSSVRTSHSIDQTWQSAFLLHGNKEIKHFQVFSSQEQVLDEGVIGKERPPHKSGLYMDTLLIRLSWLPENELQIQILETVSFKSCLIPFIWLPGG